MPMQNQARPRAGMAFSGRPQNTDFGHHGWFGNQLIAAGEGVLDGATWGQGDKIYAGIGALTDAFHGGSLKDAYRKRIAYEQARDQYYAQNYGAARTVGEVAGAFVPIPGAGPLGAIKLLGNAGKLGRFGKVLKQAYKTGERIKQVTPLARQERAVISGVGATAGAGGQLYSDAMSGHLSSWRDYAGAAAGGAVQAQLALRGRPMVAGAAGGATTSVAQDVFNGRGVSVVNAAEAAGAGGAAGKIGDAIGRVRFYRRGSSPIGREDLSQALARAGRPHTNQEKAAMGEALSKFRTLVNFDRTASTAKEKLLLTGGGHTFPDQITQLRKIIEAKAGIYARLTKRQLQALAEYGSRYRVDHLLPQDVGSLFGFIGAQGGSRLPAYLQPDQNSQ